MNVACPACRQILQAAPGRFASCPRCGTTVERPPAGPPPVYAPSPPSIGTERNPSHGGSRGRFLVVCLAVSAVAVSCVGGIVVGVLIPRRPFTWEKPGDKPAALPSLGGNREKTLTDLVAHFKGKGLEVGEVYKESMGWLGASESYWIKIGGDRVVIGKYDLTDSSEAVLAAELRKNGYISVLGTKRPTRVNGPFVLAFYNEHPQKQAILDAFNSF
jgi:hypothetical protein